MRTTVHLLIHASIKLANHLIIENPGIIFMSSFGWQKWNLMWSFAVVAHPLQDVDLLCVLRCFSEHRCCGYLTYRRSNQFGSFPLIALSTRHFYSQNSWSLDVFTVFTAFHVNSRECVWKYHGEFLEHSNKPKNHTKVKDQIFPHSDVDVKLFYLHDFMHRTVVIGLSD